MAEARHRKRSAKNACSDEYATFEGALKQVLSVSHSKMQSLLDKKRKAVKRPSSSRASND